MEGQNIDKRYKVFFKWENKEFLKAILSIFKSLILSFQKWRKWIFLTFNFSTFSLSTQELFIRRHLSLLRIRPIWRWCRWSRRTERNLSYVSLFLNKFDFIF